MLPVPRVGGHGDDHAACLVDTYKCAIGALHHGYFITCNGLIRILPEQNKP